MNTDAHGWAGRGRSGACWWFGLVDNLRYSPDPSYVPVKEDSYRWTFVGQDYQGIIDRVGLHRQDFAFYQLCYGTYAQGVNHENEKCEPEEPSDAEDTVTGDGQGLLSRRGVHGVTI